MTKRIYSFDIIRGTAIFLIVIFHRYHYHLATGYMSSWPRGVVAGFMYIMLMAGIFYMVSGSVHGLINYRRVVYGNKSPLKLFTGELATGIWIFVIHYVYRIFLMNGFIEGRHGGEPHPPIGQLIGYLRTGKQVRFYWSQITEPGTLSLIALSVIALSLVMLIITSAKIRNKSQAIYISLISSGTLIIALSPFMKFYLYPVFDRAKENGNIIIASILGQTISDFSFFPYIGFVLYGATFGIALAKKETEQNIMKWLARLSIFWLALGIIGTWETGGVDFRMLISHSLPALINKSFIRFSQLGLFLFFMWLAFYLLDFAPEKRRKTTLKVLGISKNFGILALTVYCFEPLMAEIVSIPFRLLNPDWTSNFTIVVIFSLLCVTTWFVILRIWEKIHYKGSLEWIGMNVIKAISGKKSTKLS